jgi:recombination protein RecR
MREYPAPIQTLVALLERLPGVGPKTALRYVFFLLKEAKTTVPALVTALQSLEQALRPCRLCRTYTTDELCDVCRDPRRDPSTLCVVADARDVGTIGAAGFQGRFHVLGGTISPLEGMGPDALELHTLTARLQEDRSIHEVILAFNPDPDGETTMLYLSRLLHAFPVKVSRLARGLPVGADLEFADEATLGDAIKRRWEV